MSQPAQTDAQDLAALGYKQELNRTLGSFSSFAAGFSYISILTGMFQTAALGFFFAGRAFIWAWPIVFVGQMTVALQFSELAAHYPLAGSVYQWSKRLAGKSWAWNTGWIYLCAQIVTIPAVALAWQVILPQISSKFQIVDCTTGAADSSHNCAFQDPAFAKNAFILGAIMILLTTTVNLLGVKIISTVNNIGVIAELVGAVGLIIILAVNIQHSPEVLFKTDGTGAGHDWGYAGALLLGAIMPLYVMYGFDSAGSLAEETDDPRRTAPKAIWRALLTAGVLGFLLIGFGTMAVDQPATAGGLTSITKDVLGDSWGNLWLADVALAIFVCCLAIQAMSARQQPAVRTRPRERLRQAARAGGSGAHVGGHRPDHPGLQHRQPVGLHDHHLDGHHPHVPRLPGRDDAAAEAPLRGLAGQSRRCPGTPVQARWMGEAPQHHRPP